jgi:NADH:ubiquinone oxidoreductase subunit 6 (subunit J)
MKSLFKGKRGYSPAISWVYALVSLFGIGVLYIVFSQVFTAHLVPTIKNQVISSAIDNSTQTTIISNIDKYMVYFNFLPVVLFGAIVVYLFVNSFRKEQMEMY